VVAIVVLGFLQQVFSSMILSVFLRSDFGMRLVIASVLVMPLAIVWDTLPTRHPDSAIIERASIPWIYAVNCSFSVLGSVLAIVVSVVSGFTLAFFVGLSCYGPWVVAPDSPAEGNGSGGRFSGTARDE
jgi:hypothetical protein